MQMPRSKSTSVKRLSRDHKMPRYQTTEMHYEWSFERLAQYCARGPVATERLEMLTDGRLLYRFKRAWRDGTTQIILMPLDMLAIARKIVRPNPGSPCPFGPICRSFGSSSKMEIRDRAPSAASMEADSTIHCCDVETTAYFK